MTPIPIHSVQDADLRDYARTIGTDRCHADIDMECLIDFRRSDEIHKAFARLTRSNGQLMMRCKQFELLLHEKNTELETLKAKLARARAKGKSNGNE